MKNKEKEKLPLLKFNYKEVKKMTFDHFSKWVKTYDAYKGVSIEKIKADYELMTGTKVKLKTK